MKGSKEKAYIPPVEKQRKEMGKYHEKQDMKFRSGKGKIASSQLNSSTSPLPSRPTIGKKKLGVMDYALILFLLGLGILFIFLIITVLFTEMPKEEAKKSEI